MTCNFEYSKEFQESIIELHRGKERLPSYQSYITSHLGGPSSRLGNFKRYLYPEICYHCGDLGSKRALDFGCGTGATTAVLATHCKEVVAFDIDKRSIDICRRRLTEHNLIDRVNILCAPGFEQVIGEAGTFDFILLNGVIEHIPISKAGLRRRTLGILFDILNLGGYLYINETPNRLWPVDTHTTGLWWIPWSRPGSKWAYSKAVRKGRHYDNPETHSDGPMGLEERGAWGATFFEIKRYLIGKSFEIVNSLPSHNRHLTYTQRTIKRRFFDFITWLLFSRWTKVPITALAPSITHLVIRKIGRYDDSFV